MTTEQKFRAAVNVIRGLPKSGPINPSIDTKLKFYALFKQATEGPNSTPKPYMWEVISKAKWEAWKRLGDMSKEEAMQEYLKGLNQMIENIASSGTAEEFLVGMDDFYANVPAEDVDLCFGPTIERIKAKSTTPVLSYPVAQSTPKLPSSKLEEDEDDFFLDSMDTIVADNKVSSSSGNKMVYVNGHSFNNGSNCENTVDILARSIANIRTDLDQISEAISKIENQQRSISKGRYRYFGNLSPQAIAFITLWPIFINLGLMWLYSKKRRNQ